MTIDIDAIRNRAARVRARTCEPATDHEAYELARDAQNLLAKVDALTAELDRVQQQAEIRERSLRAVNTGLAAQRADLANKLHKADQEIASLTKADTAYANEVEELKKQVCVIVTCADCGDGFEYDDSTLHFKNLDEARSIVDSEGWRYVDDKPMCGDCCTYKPHAFHPAGPNELTCQRCDLEEDDHEQAAEQAEVAA